MKWLLESGVRAGAWVFPLKAHASELHGVGIVVPSVIEITDKYRRLSSLITDTEKLISLSGQIRYVGWIFLCLASPWGLTLTSKALC